MVSERLTLKLFTEKDREDVLALFKEPDTFKYIVHLANLELSKYHEYLDLKLKQIALETGYYFVIRDRKTNDFVGAINLTPIQDTEMKQIGWQVREKYQGKGIATEASQLVLNFAKTETSFSPIYSVFVKENTASKRILEKLKFDFESEYESHGESLLRYIYHI